MFKFSLQNADGNVVNINDEVNYVVVDFEGFDPPAASLYTAKSPNRKGSQKKGSTLDERIVIITIKILGDIEVNRNALYTWTDPESELKIYFENGIKSVYCEGTVTECPVPMCTDNEVMTLAVTCTDPFLKDLQEISAEVSNLLKQFTFPFAIDSDGIPISTVRENNITNIFNAGAETGAIIRVKAKGTVSNISLFDATDATKRFDINMPLQDGEIVEINTEKSPRTVRLIKTDGTTANILKYIGYNPTWFRLKKGSNLFGVATDPATGISNVEVVFEYTTKYLGV